MNITEKHLMIAFIIAVIFLIFNIFIITTGSADAYYEQIGQFIFGEPE